MKKLDEIIEIKKAAYNNITHPYLNSERNLLIYKEEINKLIDMRILSYQLANDTDNVFEKEYPELKPITFENPSTPFIEEIKSKLLESDKYKALRLFLQDSQLM